MRGFLAFLLIILGGLLVAPASLAFWLDRQILDRNGFIELSQSVVEQELVQRALGQRVAEMAVDIGLPPEEQARAEAVALELIPVLAHSPAATDALGHLHDAVIEAARSDAPTVEVDAGAIAVDVAFVVDEVLLSMEPFTGRIDYDRSRLLTLGSIEIAREDEYGRALDVVGLLDRRALLIAVAPLVAFSLALALTRFALTTVFFIGLVTAAVGSALYWVTQKGFRDVLVEALVADTTQNRAVVSAYDAFSAPFLEQQIVLIAVGGALVVAAPVLAILGAMVRLPREA